ncbi:MAG: tRNA uridine-5-carboxymethylaminomethyl(34) synthesis GTPase MnmE [Bacteroidales bacterium]|nr:tRNA uridine-5-carboxymethylaminomethyl(34) synthesis GTPase MnmE [Bacteroidales bacterium]
MNIAAISTPSGIGGIAVVRVSGPSAISICDKVYRPFKAGNTLASRKTHTLTYGQIIDPESGEVIDEVVASVFRAPHSFTGEDVIEISCHGSLYIQQRILDVILSVEGIRLAEPGEFTRRAFRSGKMDLSQAEAVADLIAATTAASHRLAMSQMKGSISRKLDGLRLQLLNMTSLLELELDFSEEDVEFADRSQLLSLAHQIDDEVTRLASTFSAGQAIKNGIPVAIIGAPNVGKSTLLNQLLKDDRAIVSPIQGTTRDLIEDTITLGGYLFRFIDTAGIRDTSDQIEAMGIERSLRAAERAHIIILLSEPEVPFIDFEPRPDQEVIRIINKSDLAASHDETKSLMSDDSPIIHLSALTGEGVAALEQHLIELARPVESQGDIVLTNRRHYEALNTAHDHLLRVSDGLTQQLPGDLVAEDLRAVIDSLNSILGKSITSQDTLNNIFKNFCIGK